MRLQANVRSGQLRVPARAQQPLAVVQAPCGQSIATASSRAGPAQLNYAQQGRSCPQQQRSGGHSQCLHATKRGSDAFAAADGPEELLDANAPLLDYEDELEDDDLEELVVAPGSRAAFNLLPGLSDDDDPDDEPADDDEWLEEQGA